MFLCRRNARIDAGWCDTALKAGVRRRGAGKAPADAAGTGKLGRRGGAPSPGPPAGAQSPAPSPAGRPDKYLNSLGGSIRVPDGANAAESHQGGGGRGVRVVAALPNWSEAPPAARTLRAAHRRVGPLPRRDRQRREVLNAFSNPSAADSWDPEEISSYQRETPPGGRRTFGIAKTRR